MDMTECPYKNTSDLENLTLVSDMFTNPIVKQDVRNMNGAYLQDRIPNCVALAVYSCLRFSDIVQHIT
jgi:hypothetical protein